MLYSRRLHNWLMIILQVNMIIGSSTGIDKIQSHSHSITTVDRYWYLRHSC